MKLLGMFILGVFFIEFFQPIIDQLCGLICSVLEYRKGIYSYKVSKINMDIQNLECPEQDPVIGFDLSTPEEEYNNDDDDDWGEDKANMHRPMGF